MSSDKIEFKILKDADGKDVELNNLSVKAANSLVILIQNLSKIAELESNNSDVRINVSPGCACVSIEAPPAKINEIKNNIQDVVENNSNRKKEYFKSLSNIQNLFNLNGLQYDAKIFFNGEENSIIDLFDNKFSNTRRNFKKKEYYFDVEFFKAKLIENGGKTPNIHLDDKGSKIKISCTEKQAIKINKFLYQEVKIAAWGKLNSYNVKEYFFCDMYNEDLVYSEYKSFITDNMKLKGSDALENIHYKLKEYYSANEFIKAKKLIRIFNNEITDVNRLGAILLISKYFKDNKHISGLLFDIEHLLEKKLGHKFE